MIPMIVRAKLCDALSLGKTDCHHCVDDSHPLPVPTSHSRIKYTAAAHSLFLFIEFVSKEEAHCRSSGPWPPSPRFVCILINSGTTRIQLFHPNRGTELNPH